MIQSSRSSDLVQIWLAQLWWRTQHDSGLPDLSTSTNQRNHFSFFHLLWLAIATRSHNCEDHSSSFIPTNRKIFEQQKPAPWNLHLQLQLHAKHKTLVLALWPWSMPCCTRHCLTTLKPSHSLYRRGWVTRPKLEQSSVQDSSWFSTWPWHWLRTMAKLTFNKRHYRSKSDILKRALTTVECSNQRKSKQKSWNDWSCGRQLFSCGMNQESEGWAVVLKYNELNVVIQIWRRTLQIKESRLYLVTSTQRYQAIVVITPHAIRQNLRGTLLRRKSRGSLEQQSEQQLSEEVVAGRIGPGYLSRFKRTRKLCYF
jgi:hypothetical protein